MVVFVCVVFVFLQWRKFVSSRVTMVNIKKYKRSGFEPENENSV